MDKQRREIIINEIHYWQKTKLLPEQQCHYLLALYSEGEDELPEQNEAKRAKMIPFILFSQFCFLISVFILYFTDFESGLQIGFLTLLVLSTFFTWFKRRNHAMESAIHLLMLTMILFVFFLYSSFTTWTEVPTQAVIFSFVIIWLGLGLKMKQKIFYLIAAFITTVAILIFFFYQ
ncbi:hypothetical protein MKX54_07665 [Alkalihalobacillus sp. FSL R5-0424]